MLLLALVMTASVASMFASEQNDEGKKIADFIEEKYCEGDSAAK